jgi:hypothetical protein
MKLDKSKFKKMLVKDKKDNFFANDAYVYTDAPFVVALRSLYEKHLTNSEEILSGMLIGWDECKPLPEPKEPVYRWMTQREIMDLCIKENLELRFSCGLNTLWRPFWMFELCTKDIPNLEYSLRDGTIGKFRVEVKGEN